jgi:SAM-dependent methyltransferase
VSTLPFAGLRGAVTADAFREHAAGFAGKLAALKLANPLTNYGWYPYDSLTCCPVLAELVGEHIDTVLEAARREAVLDLGCADGDLAFLFASLGCEVDAVDHPQSNFNQMFGVQALARLLPGVMVHALDLDARFELPRKTYGFALFLGTLYHLRNPFYALEALAERASYCVVSTRIAQRTPSGLPIGEEPVAYLLGPREANNDPTNFWIFSRAGLLRLVRRAGWSVESELRLGCLSESNPVDAEADERIFLLLRSRIRFPSMHFRLLDGWHAVEGGRWRWTQKRFSFEASLPEDETPREFALKISVPEAVLEAHGVTLFCEINGRAIGSNSFHTPGTHEYRGSLDGFDTSEPLLFQFLVKHDFSPEGDRRSLGVIVETAGDTLPFRIS